MAFLLVAGDFDDGPPAASMSSLPEDIFLARTGEPNGEAIVSDCPLMTGVEDLLVCVCVWGGVYIYIIYL